MFPMLCCDLYEEIKMAVFYIHIYRIYLFLLFIGGEILMWDVMHFWECLYLWHIGLHI